MNSFEMTRPATPQEAARQLAEAGSVALAGGQDLLALLKDNVLAPGRVVNLKSLPGLNQIAVRGGRLELGALVTLGALAAHDAVKSGWPLLGQAAGEVGTPQIRNAATVGGNLAQQPRCWYYRASAFACALKPGGQGCPAIAGDNRYHSVLANDGCANPFLVSLALPLAAYGATVRLHGPTGPRELSLADLYPAGRLNALAPGEIIVGVSVPDPAGWRGAHEEVRFRQSQDWPIASATVLLQLAGGAVTDARVVLGGVAPVPYQPAAAVAALRGRRVDAAVASAAAEAAVADARPLAHNGYKVTVCRNLVRRVILAAAGVENA